MNRQELLERIAVNLNICSGKPCIRGHRIWVSLILDFFAGGATIAEILEDYPQLSADDILACLSYGAEMTRERFVDVAIKCSNSHYGTRLLGFSNLPTCE